MTPGFWTIRDLLKVTTDYLKEKEIDNPRLTAEVLLAHQLNIDRLKLYLELEQPLTASELSGYRSLIKRRLRHEPLQYITGVQEFWSLDFVVDPRVLIPRPETELLVEQGLRLIETMQGPADHSIKILDLGTGCGAIGIALAREIPDADIWATDISADALQVASLNARKHGVSDRIQFSQGDLWEPFVGIGIMTFDIIVSNPPYIPTEEYPSLQPEVRDYEPSMALDGHPGGMYYIEKILTEAPKYMNQGGWLLMEMDPDQTGKALRFLEGIGAYAEKERVKDYSHRYRAILARKRRVEINHGTTC
jgi:release factor glutamine methyltransferase